MDIDPKIKAIYDLITHLTITEQRALLALLRDDPDSAVREPRRPKPPRPGDTVALKAPEEEEWVVPDIWIA